MTRMQPGPAPILGWPTALAIGLYAGVLLGLAATYYLMARARTDHQRHARPAGDLEGHRRHVCTEQTCDRREDRDD